METLELAKELDDVLYALRKIDSPMDNGEIQLVLHSWGINKDIVAIDRCFSILLNSNLVTSAQNHTYKITEAGKGFSYVTKFIQGEKGHRKLNNISLIVGVVGTIVGLVIGLIVNKC